MPNRSDYFESLLEMFTKHIEASDPRTEWELQNQILTFIETNELPEADYEGPYEGDGKFAENH